jgi:hypothetical protein
MTTPNAGPYRKVRRPIYESWDAVNQSNAKTARKSMAHALEEKLHPKEDTEAQGFGQALHMAILDPSAFETEFAFSPLNPETGRDYDRRTKEGKAAWTAFEAQNKDKILVKGSEAARIRRISEKVWAHPTAREILGGRGTNELGVVWTDPESGVLCKALIDRVTQFEGWTTIVDLKSTVDASDDGWPRQVMRWGYHIQAAYYMDGFNSIQEGKRRFVFIAVEKDPPYALRVHEPKPSAIAQGRIEYKALLLQFAEALKNDYWPSYPEGVNEFNLPEWAYKENV